MYTVAIYKTVDGSTTFSHWEINFEKKEDAIERANFLMWGANEQGESYCDWEIYDDEENKIYEKYDYEIDILNRD